MWVSGPDVGAFLSMGSHQSRDRGCGVWWQDLGYWSQTDSMGLNMARCLRGKALNQTALGSNLG